MSHSNCGFLAAQSGFSLPLQILCSAAGFYIGTCDQEGPVSRESVEYFPDEYTANHSLAANMWTQRASP